MWVCLRLVPWFRSVYEDRFQTFDEGSYRKLWLRESRLYLLPYTVLQKGLTSPLRRLSAETRSVWTVSVSLHWGTDAKTYWSMRKGRGFLFALQVTNYTCSTLKPSQDLPWIPDQMWVPLLHSENPASSRAWARSLLHLDQGSVQGYVRLVCQTTAHDSDRTYKRMAPQLCRVFDLKTQMEQNEISFKKGECQVRQWTS